MVTRVVHCKREKYTIYIGRPAKYGNPYSHKEGTLAIYKVASVEEAIQKFEEYLLKNPKLLAEVRKECKDQILGCWCKPGLCHGDIIAKLCDENN